MDTDINTDLTINVDFQAVMDISADWFNDVDTILKGLKEYAAGTKTLQELGFDTDITSGRALYLADSEDAIELGKRIVTLALREYLPKVLTGEADFKKVTNVRIKHL